MKRSFASFLLVISLLVFSINCAQSNKQSRRPVSTITIEPHKKNYRLGEEIQLNLTTKIKDGSLEKVEVSLDGILLETSKKLTNTIILKTGKFGVGKHIIKISACKSDGICGDNYQEILITSDTKPVQYTYQIISVFPHNPTHFTQGLEFNNNNLYESTGQEGTSSIYQLNLNTGKVLRELKLDNQYFGEGITILNGKIYELTYKNRIGFVYDLKSFALLNTWKYKSQEGWGLTNDGKSLIMSDGTENIYFIDPETFQETRRIQVCNEHNFISNLNELEYIKGELWANIWTTDTIVIIDPVTGKLKGEINLSGLAGTILQNQKEQIDVLNGIAWNSVSDKIYVTGKLWPKLFEIKLIKNQN